MLRHGQFCLARLPRWAIFFPHTGSWESKCIQKMAGVGLSQDHRMATCPHSVAGPCWVPRMGAEQTGLTHPLVFPLLRAPAPIESSFSGCVSMGQEACCWPTPNKIWARSSVGINGFGLISFNETTQISAHSGWF